MTLYRGLILCLILGLIQLCGNTTHLSAQGKMAGSMHGLGTIEYFTLEYEPLNQTYHIYIRTPEIQDENELLPTIYLLDGGLTFPLLSAYYQYLYFGEEVPRAILIGISYGTGDWKEGNSRSRDYTLPVEERTHWGGADSFSIFLQNGLIPKIENNYPADPQKRILFGQSIGGQFVLFMAQYKPEVFWGYIASNPALHRNLEAFISPSAQAQYESPIKMFVSTGSLDDPRFHEPTLNWMNYWANNQPSFWHLNTKILEGQTHFSAAPEAFRQGMKWIFKDSLD